MDFERVFKDIGSFGKTQKIQYLLLCFATILAGVLSLNLVFLAARPHFTCRLSNSTEDYIQNLLSKGNSTDAPDVLLKQYYDEIIALNLKEDRCKSYDQNTIESSSNFTKMLNISSGQLTPKNLAKMIAESKDTWNEEYCEYGYIYDDTYFMSTIVTDWNLVCKDSHKAMTIKTVFFIGRLVGAGLFGQVSDRFGRVLTFTVVSVVSLVGGIGLICSVNWIMFAVFIFLQGTSQTGYTLTCSVLGNELVAPQYRKWTGTMVHMFYAISFLIIPGFYLAVKSWRYLLFTSIVPSLIFIFYRFFVYESPRWLMSRGRTAEAVKILEDVAKKNGKQLSEETRKDLLASNKKGDEDTGKTYTFWHLFMKPKRALQTLNICFNWVANSLAYYGIIYNLENMGKNPYINFAIFGILEVPAIFFIILLMDRIGRKMLLIGTLVLGGVSCIVAGFIPGGDVLGYIKLSVGMLGKFGITMSYVVIYAYSSEMLPTVVRNLGMGIASMSARVGGTLASPTLELRKVYPPLPMIILGSTALVAAVLSFFFPETMGKSLKQNYSDEDISEGQQEEKIALNEKEVNGAQKDAKA